MMRASEELESTDITLIAGISLIVTLLLFVMVAVYLKGSNSSTKTDLEIQEVDLHRTAYRKLRWFSGSCKG